MSKVYKKQIVGGILFLFLLFFLCLFFYSFSYRQKQESPLYLAVSGYNENSKYLELPEGIIYDDNSGEKIFIEAFELYLSMEYDRAREYFLYSLECDYHDPALPAYAYYFADRCDYIQNRPADQEIILKALEEICNYPPLANDTALLWNLIGSISSSEDTDHKIISLLEEYLIKAKGLELSTWAWIKNYIAMLEYNNEKYAKSIRHFYDVETALSSVKQTKEITTELHYAKEYIANIHFSFKDYEKAAELYEDIIHSIPKTDSFNGYLSCTNLATCYLEINNLKKARETMDFLEEKLPQIPEYLQPEIKASIYDILANIALKEKNYPLADTYLTLSENYYDNAYSSGILGGHFFTRLTRCNYLVQLKRYDEALPHLLGMLANEEAIYYGFEEDVYSLLKIIYYETGEHEELHKVQEKLLSLNSEFEQTIQREYLEFSSYYKENNKLKAYNAILSRRSTIAIFSTLIVSVLLIIFFVFLKILTKKNITDQLTGVYNRKKLNRLIRYYNRFGTPSDFAVIMMDIDYFKKYNDSYGHPEGDNILKKVAKILMSCVRSKDILIRYGGEEFLLLATGVSSETASSICQRIKEQINDASLPHKASEVSDHVTLSMGLCHQSEAKTLNFEALVEEADQCLYQSKEKGRNQFTVNYL